MFWSKVNIWNMNCPRAAAFIFDTRTDVLVEVSKCLRQLVVGGITWQSDDRVWVPYTHWVESNESRSYKQLHLLCPPDPWNLPGTALPSGFHWVRQFFVNIVSLGKDRLFTSEMTVEHERNFYVGLVKRFHNFWHCMTGRIYWNSATPFLMTTLHLTASWMQCLVNPTHFEQFCCGLLCICTLAPVDFTPILRDHGFSGAS